MTDATLSEHANDFEDTDNDVRVRRPLATAALWFGVFAAPAAFMLGLIANYALSSGQCTTRHLLLIHTIHLLTVVTGIAGVAMSYRMQRRREHGARADRIGAGVR